VVKIDSLVTSPRERTLDGLEAARPGPQGPRAHRRPSWPPHASSTTPRTRRWLRLPGSLVFPVPPCTPRAGVQRGRRACASGLVIPGLGHRVGGLYVSAPMTGRHGRRFRIGARVARWVLAQRARRPGGSGCPACPIGSLPLVVMITASIVCVGPALVLLAAGAWFFALPPLFATGMCWLRWAANPQQRQRRPWSQKGRRPWSCARSASRIPRAALSARSR